MKSHHRKILQILIITVFALASICIIAEKRKENRKSVHTETIRFINKMKYDTIQYYIPKNMAGKTVTVISK